MKYLVIIEKGEKNYSAFSPDVLGCVATGDSVEATLNNMREALQFHFEGMIEDGENIPLPKGLNFYLEQTDDISADDLIAHIDIPLPSPAFA